MKELGAQVEKIDDATKAEAANTVLTSLVTAVNAIMDKCNTARSATADDAVSADKGKGCRFSGNIYDMLSKDT